MSVEHLGTVTGLAELVYDTVQVLGVSQANFIYIDDMLHTDFTFDVDRQVGTIPVCNLFAIVCHLVTIVILKSAQLATYKFYAM